MSRERRPRRTLLWLVVLAAIGVAFLLGGRELFEAQFEQLRNGARGDAPSGMQGRPSGRVPFADGTAGNGARVTVERSGASAATELVTSADGAYELPLDAGETVTRVSVAFGPHALDVLKGSLLGGEVSCKLPTSFDVAGLVQAGPERTPVAGATVRVGGVAATTDDDGAFRVVGVPETAARNLPVRVSVEKDGFVPLEHAVAADAHPAVYGDLNLLLEAVK